MEAPEIDKIEDALLSALSLLVLMSQFAPECIDPETDPMTATIQKLKVALHRWEEIEKMRLALCSTELN